MDSPPLKMEPKRPAKQFGGRGAISQCTRWPRAPGQTRYPCPVPPWATSTAGGGFSPVGLPARGQAGLSGGGSAAAEGEAISVEKPFFPAFPLHGVPGAEHRGTAPEKPRGGLAPVRRVSRGSPPVSRQHAAPRGEGAGGGGGRGLMRGTPGCAWPRGRCGGAHA